MKKVDWNGLAYRNKLFMWSISNKSSLNWRNHSNFQKRFIGSGGWFNNFSKQTKQWCNTHFRKFVYDIVEQIEEATCILEKVYLKISLLCAFHCVKNMTLAGRGVISDMNQKDIFWKFLHEIENTATNTVWGQSFEDVAVWVTF